MLHCNRARSASAGRGNGAAVVRAGDLSKTDVRVVKGKERV